MKTLTIIPATLLLSVLACAAPGQEATAAGPDAREVRWDVEPGAGKNGAPRLELSEKTSSSDLSLDDALVQSRPEFADARRALGGTGAVTFSIRHAAGTLDCGGKLTRAYTGVGHCAFTSDAGFEAALAERGLAPHQRSDLLAMLLVDATIELADGLAHEGVRPKDNGDLIAAAALGVTPAYVHDLKSEALVLTDIDKAIACKALGVDGTYVRALAAAGYRNLDADEVVSMKATGVTGEYAQAMNRAAQGEQP